MSAIRCIYTEEPKFPASDQHPAAVRYVVGALWVDAVGGAPTQTEIDAILHPSVVKSAIDLTIEYVAAKVDAPQALKDYVARIRPI
jgi:hypothetical protein